MEGRLTATGAVIAAIEAVEAAAAAGTTATTVAVVNTAAAIVSIGQAAGDIRETIPVPTVAASTGAAGFVPAAAAITVRADMEILPSGASAMTVMSVTTGARVLFPARAALGLN